MSAKSDVIDTVGTKGSAGFDGHSDASPGPWQPPIAKPAATGLAMIVLLASGCASQPNHGLNDSSTQADKAQQAAKLLDDAQRRNNLPYDPLETIDTLSGMHPRAIEAVIQAVAQLGTPYQWGGESAENGFDCSGLTQHAFKAASIELPRTSAQQYRATQRIERESLRPGDLVFFRLDGKRVDHVGLYVGGDRFIHAPSSGKTVSFASLDNVFWSRKYVGAGRAAEANELQLAGNRPEGF